MLVLKINTDNAAFEEDMGDEVARILRYAAAYAYNRMREVEEGIKLFDVNGNCVGAFYRKEKDHEEV